MMEKYIEDLIKKSIISQINDKAYGIYLKFLILSKKSDLTDQIIRE